MRSFSDVAKRPVRLYLDYVMHFVTSLAILNWGQHVSLSKGLRARALSKVCCVTPLAALLDHYGFIS